jgi:hypothetical protein
MFEMASWSVKAQAQVFLFLRCGLRNAADRVVTRERRLVKPPGG